MRRLLVTCALAATLGAVGVRSTVAAAATPIPEGPGAASLPQFLGAPATPQPVAASVPPQNPSLAANGSSNIHEDAYMTDASARTGPLGRDMSRLSTFFGRECASLTFDRAGRIVTVCVGLDRPVLELLDPRTLDTIASFDLPPRQPSVSTSPFTDFSGGGYFYLDGADRAVVPTTDRHIDVVADTGNALTLVRSYDLTAAVGAQDAITSALPDWSGGIWFVSSKGVVGRVDPSTGAVHAIDTHELIGNSFAVDETGGVYVVTDAALYRFDTGPGGVPVVSWRQTYPNDGTTKPGQTEVGSGTTPTLMGPDLVSITDNADPIDIVVMRRARTLPAGVPRVVCTQPVFDRGASDSDNSLIATDRSMVVENNYGYSGPSATENGASTTGGLERVDVDPALDGCHPVWRSPERAPSVVAKLSRGSGLVYTYTKDPRSDGQDAWYLTALDFRTGATRFKRLAGEGLGFNNNYAPVSIGPDGTAYVGVLGGLVALRDAVPPPQGLAPSLGMTPTRTTTKRRGRLRVHVRVRRTRRRCVIRLAGPDRHRVRRLVALVRRTHRIAADRRPPLRLSVRRRHRRVRVVAIARDGRRARFRVRC